jgi:hypothetical protein
MAFDVQSCFLVAAAVTPVATKLAACGLPRVTEGGYRVVWIHVRCVFFGGDKKKREVSILQFVFVCARIRNSRTRTLLYSGKATGFIKKPGE